MSHENQRSGEAGFTLIEALVALAIVTVALASIGGLVAIVSKGTRSVSQRVALAATAESLLTELPVRNSLVPGHQTGVKDGNRWSVDITPAYGRSSGQWIPLQIVLDVRAATGMSLRLTTIRLIPGSPQ